MGIAFERGTIMRFLRFLRDFFYKADLLLLLLCLSATVFGMVVISSVTGSDARSYLTVQLIATVLGLCLYVFFTGVDIDIIAEQWKLLLIASVVFIASLRVLGSSDNTGNRSWIYISFLHMSVQPAEICKIAFILIIAKRMSVKKEKISSPLTVAELTGYAVFLALLIIAVSSDTGVALPYLFLLIVLLFAGGVAYYWFIAGAGAVALAVPLLWGQLRDDQKLRIQALFDPSVDPTGHGVLWQSNLAKQAISNGGLLGQGLGHGSVTQSGHLPQQHTDFIFSAIGEELGILGGLLALGLLTAIIVRILYVGFKSGNYMNRLICVGIAGMLTFQIIVNVGMNVGLMPVIGLTLPFFSYGGSSIVTMYAAVGIVSGIHMRPAPDTQARYIRPNYEKL